jgi:O-acetyl-ADP-ribose deacetylase (regulator of RNase III)
MALAISANGRASGRDLEGRMNETAAERVIASGQVIKIIHGDLTQARVDAIVNAANAYLAHGGGVAGAIVRQGGEEIQRESDAWVREHGPITPERPAITGAGRLPCRFVIHAVGPVWGEGDEDRKLYTAVYNALALAADREFASIALPAISTGIFRFPLERAAEMILDAIRDFFRERGESPLREVHIILFESGSVEPFLNELAQHFPQDSASE